MHGNTHNTQKVTPETRATLAVSLCAHRGVRRKGAGIPHGCSLQYFSFHSQGVGHHIGYHWQLVEFMKGLKEQTKLLKEKHTRSFFCCFFASCGLLWDVLYFPECPTGDSVVQESISMVPLAGSGSYFININWHFLFTYKSTFN